MSPSRHPMGSLRCPGTGSPAHCVGPAATSRPQAVHMLPGSARSPATSARSPTPIFLERPEASSPTPIFFERPEANTSNPNTAGNVISAPRWANPILADAMSQVERADTARSQPQSTQQKARRLSASPVPNMQCEPQSLSACGMPNGNRICGAPRPLLPAGIRNACAQPHGYSLSQPQPGGGALMNRSPSTPGARESPSPSRIRTRPQQGILSPGRNRPKPHVVLSPSPRPPTSGRGWGTPCPGRTPSPGPFCHDADSHGPSSVGGVGISFLDSRRRSPSPQCRADADCHSSFNAFADVAQQSLSPCWAEKESQGCNSMGIAFADSARRGYQMQTTAFSERQALKPGIRWDQLAHGCSDMDEADFESDLAQAVAASEESYSADVEWQRREEADLAAAMKASLYTVAPQNVGSRPLQMAPRLRFEVPRE